MERVPFGPEVAPVLLRKIQEVRLGGLELAGFSDEHPFLASECGIEISALEAKTLLGSGIFERIYQEASEANRMGRGFFVAHADLEGVKRMEGVVSLAASRIAQRYMALEASASNSHKLGSVISAMSGIFSLIRAVF